MRGFGYIRVSTEDQAQDDRYSISTQTNKIKAYFQKNKIKLIDIFTDDVSGKSIIKRNGFKEMMSRLDEVDLVAVVEVDRHARNMLDSLTTVNEIINSGKIFVAIDDNITLDSKSSENDELNFHVKSMFSHYFSRQLSRKVHANMMTKAAEGQWNTKPPFGYKLENKKLVPDPEESWIVKKMFEMYLENKGFRAITEYFNSIGIKTRTGAAWNTFPVKRILTNQVYIGNTIWNKTKRVNSKEIKRPQDDWVITENTHEPIIDKETFRLIQERIERKKSMGGRAQSSPYLLAGILRCGHCGSPMIGNTNRGRVRKSGEAPVYHRYVCSGYHKQGICRYVFVHKEAIESKIFANIKAFIGTPDEAKMLLNQRNTDYATIRTEHKRLKSELENIKNKFQRQFEAFEAGVIDLAELKQAKERVKEQEEGIKKELTILEEQLNSIDITTEQRIRMADFYNIIATGDIQQIKVLLQQNIRQITFTDIDNTEIEWYL